MTVKIIPITPRYRENHPMIFNKKKRGRKRDLSKESAIVYQIENGKTFQAAGDMFGISRQRAHFIYRRAKNEKEKRV